MNERPSWACLSVREFFSHSNWQGKPTKQLFESTSPEPPRLCLTVQEYFSHSNWQGLPLACNDKLMRSPSSLTLPVGEFFQFIVWEGEPKIAALPQITLSPELTTSPSHNLKLTDLSDLF